jgi:hypothetical protein
LPELVHFLIAIDNKPSLASLPQDRQVSDSGHVRRSGGTLVPPAAAGLITVILRRLKAWGVALRCLNSPDQIGFSQPARLETEGSCLFLHLFHIHGLSSVHLYIGNFRNGQ